MDSLSQIVESKLLPIANKMSSQRHLKAIRDAFMSIIPITLIGGIFAVISSAPITENTTNGFLLAWASFADKNSLLLNWVNALTLGAMSLYICIGIANFLSKHFKMDPFFPIMLSVCGFFMLVIAPIELGWAGKTVEISYIGGEGLIPAILISCLTVEAYHYMREHNWGRIKLPDSVPASLNETFASLCPGVCIIATDIILFAIFNAFNTTMPGFIYNVMAPTLNAADSLPFAIIATLLVHFFWFFGIHDAAFSGILGPVRDGGLSLNAAAHAAGQTLPKIFTTPFWVYFVAIGGCGSCLALAILLVRSKSKQLNTVGKVGIIPSFFGISEPLIFGIPLMLNPIFFVPFLLTSTVNCIIAYISMSVGIVGKTFAMLSWQMPSVFGSFLSTMDIKAFILVIILIIIDLVMYYPFFKVYEKQLVAQESE